MKKKIIDEILQDAPGEIKELLFKCSITPQSPEWHPEGPDEIVPHNVLFHTNAVFDNCMKFNPHHPYLFDLLMAAIFHDLGKVKTTKLNKKGTWSAYGHEFESAKILENHKKWVISKGGNFDRIYNIVNFHMRIKYLDEMKKSKHDKMKSNPYFEELMIFTKCDNMR
jgi:hypothetical protein